MSLIKVKGSSVDGGVEIRKTALPIIVNGDMAVAQRTTGTVAQADSSNEGYASVDRFAVFFGNSAGGTITTSRSTTAPTGFGQSMKLDVTSADTSVGSTHVVNLQHSIEAQTIRNSGWDYTSSSSYITLSFQIRSSKTGTYCIFVQTVDGTSKMYTAEYTINSADTWEQKVIAIPGDSGLSVDDNTGKGLNIAWVLAVGTDRDGTAGSWTTGNAYGTSNQVNFLDSTSNELYITGVQLEVGQYTASSLPPFQHESYGDNLRRCQRYYCQVGTVGATQSGFAARAFSSSGMVWAVPVPVPFRAEPSITVVGTIRAFAGDSTTYKDSTSASISSYGNTNSSMIMLQSTGFSSITDNKAYNVHAINDTSYKFDAEL